MGSKSEQFTRTTNVQRREVMVPLSHVILGTGEYLTQRLPNTAHLESLKLDLPTPSLRLDTYEGRWVPDTEDDIFILMVAMVKGRTFVRANDLGKVRSKKEKGLYQEPNLMEDDE